MSRSQPIELVAAARSPLASQPIPALPLAAEAEARAFWRMRLRILRTMGWQMLTQARFRLALMVVLTVTLWAGLFWLFSDGVRLLHSVILDRYTRDQTEAAIFGALFATVMVMLVFSAAIIIYSFLFHSREASLLLTLPVRPARVFVHKFQETVLLSSWGFVLLGSPLLLAYGMQAEAPWYYYALLLPLLVAFVYIPVSIGAVLCLVVMRYLPQKRLHVLLGGALGLAALGAWLAWRLLAASQGNLLTPGWFRETLGMMQLFEQRLLPSWWLSSAVRWAARGVWPRSLSESVLFLALLISNALLCRQLAVWVAARLYRAAYCRVQHRPSRACRPAAGWLDRLAFCLSAPLARSMQLLIVKDLRLLRRDPLQWSQLLIFGGLLAFYFANVRRFNYQMDYAGWVSLLSFLNLAVVGLLMAAFTTRFIFPMISLEAQRFWLLGLLPIGRDTILWAKFIYAAAGSLGPCCGLILLSDGLLGVPLWLLLSHQLTCAVLCTGLAGIAVGLGARLPNLRQRSPSRIAAGFGGTLSLVLSCLYIMSVVLLTALPWHFFLVAQQGGTHALLDGSARIEWYLRCWLVAGSAGSVLLGLAASLVPLWIGIRAFRCLEA